MSFRTPVTLLLITALLASFLCGCEGLLPPPPQTPTVPTPTRTQTLTITPTTVWFPPTFTLTPAPVFSSQPTPDQRPGLGEIILKDDFSTRKSWQTGRTGTGSMAFGTGELTLAVTTPKGMLTSIRSDVLQGDFYLEMTASPSLCRGTDQYGILVRAASAVDGYRFMVTCSGQIRMERIKNGEIVPLQDWTISGQVPPGSPLVLRLGIWVVRNEMRFFINDFYQFSARDPVFTNGRIGVFARSNGDTPLTVSFSALEVRRVTATLATITPTPSRTATRAPILRTRVPTLTKKP